jgi:hypothetical protein
MYTDFTGGRGYFGCDGAWHAGGSFFNRLNESQAKKALAPLKTSYVVHSSVVIRARQTAARHGPASSPDAYRQRVTYDVSAEQFITAWEQAGSAEEVVEKLGMPKAIVHARASTYRSAGIKLKKMPRKARKRLDVDALNKLIEKIRGTQGGGGENEDESSRPRQG